MDKAMQETKRKVKEYYKKVGQLHIDPLDIPETPDEIEIYTGWFFNRIRNIVAVENSHRKFGDMKEVLTLLGVAAGDLNLSITFTYYEDVGQLFLEFNQPEDYLFLPVLAKHFGLLWRFKWRPNTLYAGDPDEVFEKSEVVHEGSGDMFAYDRGGRD